MSDILKAIQSASEADVEKLDAEIGVVEVEISKLQNKIDGLRLAKKVLSTVLHGVPQRAPRGTGKAAIAKAKKAAATGGTNGTAVSGPPATQSAKVANDITASLTDRIADLLEEEGSLPILVIAERLQMPIPMCKLALTKNGRFKQLTSGDFGLR